MAEREKSLNEKDSIKDLEAQSRNSRRFVDRMNEAHYNMNVGELVHIVENMAKVVVALVEKEHEK